MHELFRNGKAENEILQFRDVSLCYGLDDSIRSQWTRTAFKGKIRWMGY